MFPGNLVHNSVLDLFTLMTLHVCLVDRVFKLFVSKISCVV